MLYEHRYRKTAHPSAASGLNDSARPEDLAQLAQPNASCRNCERYPGPASTHASGGGNTAQHLSEAVTRLIQALAARNPLVLFVDDWHWANMQARWTCCIMPPCAGRLKLPILLILTLRQSRQPNRLNCKVG